MRTTFHTWSPVHFLWIQIRSDPSNQNWNQFSSISPSQNQIPFSSRSVPVPKFFQKVPNLFLKARINRLPNVVKSLMKGDGPEVIKLKPGYFYFSADFDRNTLRRRFWTRSFKKNSIFLRIGTELIFIVNEPIHSRSVPAFLKRIQIRSRSKKSGVSSGSGTVAFRS